MRRVIQKNCIYSKQKIIFFFVTAAFFSFIPSFIYAEHTFEDEIDKNIEKKQADINKKLSEPENKEEFNDDFDDDFDEFEDEFEENTDLKVFDPLSGYNRLMTVCNDKLYFWAFKPVAKGYSFVVPEPGRVAVNRCFRNIMFPVRLTNNLLQLKFKNAGIETLRFGINTTIGILGFGDPAQSRLKLKPCPEDFGQTLGRYGIGSGFHIVLPFFGPSNLRDAIGKIPDHFLNPVNYIEEGYAVMGINVYNGFNSISLHIGEYESLQKGAVDFYILLRDAYEQNRIMKIKE